MSAKYTVAVGNTVEVPVKFTLKEGKVNRVFAFTLTAERLEQSDIETKVKEAEYKFKEALQSMGCFTGWSGQKLILDEEGKPAEFNDESFDALLGIPMVAAIVFQAYQKECGAKEKN
jgi:hypothetical protein